MDYKLLLEYPEISNTETTLIHLLIRLVTPPVSDSPTRRPLVVGLAIDKSKSMFGEKISSTLEAASSLVNWLTRHDHLAVVAYDSTVEVVQPLTPLTDKFSVIKKLDNIRVGTSTNMSGGWLQALKSVESSSIENAFKRVILLTDGMANTGVVSMPELIGIARDHYERKISTTTIGFGRDFSENLLREIAKEGGGNFYFIEGPEQAHEVFFKEFGDIAALFGQGLEIKLNAAPGVSVKEILNDTPYSNIDDDQIVLRPGDLRSDDLKNIIIVLEVNGKEASSSQTLITSELSYYNLLEGSRLEKHDAAIDVNFKSKPSTGYNKTVRLEALIAASGRAMIEASRISGEKDLSAARDVLAQMISRLKENEAIDIDTIKGIIRRLTEMERNLEENLNITRKHMMAGGADVINRTLIGDHYVLGKSHDNIMEMQLNGQLDLYKCPELKSDIKRHIDGGYRFVLFDLTDLTYVDSSGIGTLIQISNWMKKRGGLMVLVNTQGSVEKIFQISKLDEFFIFKDTVSEGRLFVEEIIESAKL